MNIDKNIITTSNFPFGLVLVISYGLLLTGTASALGLRLLVAWLETTNQMRAMNEKSIAESDAHAQRWTLRFSKGRLRLVRLGSFGFSVALLLLANFVLLL